MVLDRAVRLAQDVEDPLPISVAELAADLPRALAERDGVDALHFDEEHPDQVHGEMLRDRIGEGKAKTARPPEEVPPPAPLPRNRGALEVFTENPLDECHVLSQENSWVPARRVQAVKVSVGLSIAVKRTGKEHRLVTHAPNVSF